VRYLVDATVVSELRKGKHADRGVREWSADGDSDDLALSVLVLAEIRLAILRVRERAPTATGRLAMWLVRLRRAYQGRMFPVDDAAAEVWAHLSAPRPLPVIDSLQAATALVHGLTLVTRNSSRSR
jgi:predicted nucleic acid-binding protein